jgi:hypothetical protein
VTSVQLSAKEDMELVCPDYLHVVSITYKRKHFMFENVYCTVLYYCHRVTTQLQLTNISCHKLPYFGRPAVEYLLVRILKDKISSVHTTKAYRGSTGTAPLILHLGPRWRFVVSFTPRPIHHRRSFKYRLKKENPCHRQHSTSMHSDTSN